MFSLDAGQGKLTVKSKQPISTLAWHKIKVVRDHKIVKLTVDKQDTVEGMLPKTFDQIDLETGIIIGEPQKPERKYV